MVAVGQEHLAGAAVFDPDDASLGQLAHRPVHRVDRAAQPPGQGRAGGHPAAGSVAVAQQQRVQPERGVVDVGVDHPLRDNREPRLLDNQGVGVADRRWNILRGHHKPLRARDERWACHIDTRQRVRQGCVRKCSETARKHRLGRPNRHTAPGRLRRSQPDQPDPTHGEQVGVPPTDQKVGGSNPSGRASISIGDQASDLLECGLGPFGCMDEAPARYRMTAWEPRWEPRGCDRARDSPPIMQSATAWISRAPGACW